MGNYFHQLTINGRADCRNVVVSIIISSVDYCFYFFGRVAMDWDTIVFAIRGESMGRKTAVGWYNWAVDSMAVVGCVLGTG